MTRLQLDIWSDIACPWCYVGKRRLEAALQLFQHRSSVDVVWRAFELDPSAPAVRDASQTYAERLAAKYRCGVREAEGMIARMTQVGQSHGLEFRFDRVRGGNTFDAHRLLHLAREHGRQDAMKERLCRAYMTEGQALGDRDVLVRLAGECGIATDVARAALDSQAGANEVLADEATARELGISGVPCFVLDGRYAISGAQMPEVLLRALERAWSDRAAADSVVADSQSEGAVCGPSGC